MTSLNFSIPRNTQYLWQQILPHWEHRDRPVGQRFLGSIQISQKATDQVLDVVSYNLKNLSKFTYKNLYERFYELEQNWVKILTFALSEYAYYYSGVEEKFWYGFCQRLKLPYSQSKENTLRRIVSEGFDLLGIVKAKGGYRCVSTLWLQSGIPKENINHFAQIVQDFSNEYGWWEIAHTSYEDLSQELLDYCQEKHPQWGTLIHFLKSSCSQKEEEEVEPISGQLVQGIAVVASELERQRVSPERLKNDNEREQLLGNYDLPNNFFLRNWDSLIQVLTPQQRRQRSSRKIISCRQKSLSLVLDVAAGLNMQIMLPEQKLWKKEWERLGGTFCQIPEAAWEGTIPKSAGLMIPEQVVNIRTVDELWTWHLLDHRGNSLSDWKLEGVASDLPCLIFDAWTGDRLNLDPVNLAIKGSEEIICFTPRGVHINFGNGIEVLDSCVPSSIRGWQGQQLRLTTKESSIAFSSEKITWKLSLDQQPGLRGLKLKGKKSVYLETPTFWYPPSDREISLNVSVDNITHRQNIISTTEIVPPSDRWQAIPLDKWITEPGKYEARFWNQFHRWSYQFEVQSDYRITGKPDVNELRINSGLQGKIETLPISYDFSDKFWAEEIQIEGLWPLEVLNFSLSDQEGKVFSLGQADSSGHLRMNLAALHDLLPDSNWYALDYQQLGREPQRLIEMETAPLAITWTWANQAIHLSGLSSDQLYSLSCWNLLLPQNPPVEIKIPLISPDQQTITVPLEIPPGIYHVQLVCSRRLPHNIGWWCGSRQYDLPDEAQEDQVLAYCYTILDNEAVLDFVNAAQNFDYDYQWLKIVIDSLHNLPHQFPEWLHLNSLKEKLQALFTTLETEFKNPSLPEEKTVLGKAKIDNSTIKVTQSILLLVRLTNPKKRQLVSKRIQIIIEQHQFQNKIAIIPILNTMIYNEILLLECSNYEMVYPYLQQIEYIQKIDFIKPEDVQKILKL